MSPHVTGRCLCGAVRLAATLPSHDLTLCWCSQCQALNSGPLVSTEAAEAWEISGPVATFRASDHATRGFCPACGSTLYWQENEQGPSFALGALDTRDGYRIAHVVHAETRPDAWENAAAG